MLCGGYIANSRVSCLVLSVAGMVHSLGMKATMREFVLIGRLKKQNKKTKRQKKKKKKTNQTKQKQMDYLKSLQIGSP
jgi:hypothetical protein